MSPTSYQTAPPRANKNGDPYGNRTRDTAVKGRCLNRLTNGPLAPQVGFEPTTYRLTAGCSTTELLRNDRLAASYPHRGKPPTTFGVQVLNFRVRHGNGCDHLAIVTRRRARALKTEVINNASARTRPRPISITQLRMSPCFHP